MRKKSLDIIYKEKFALKYLRENSHWYKYLNRSDEAVIKLIEEMKVRYSNIFKDKVNKAKTSLNLINAFMSVTKENN